jgi:hypothetical protein
MNFQIQTKDILDSKNLNSIESFEFKGRFSFGD